MRYPSDHASHDLAQLMQHTNDYRSLLTQSVFLSGDPEQPVDRMEHAFQLLTAHEDLYHSMIAKSRSSHETMHAQLLEKVAAGVLLTEELEIFMSIEKACWDAIQVDEFDFDAVNSKHCEPVKQMG